MGLLLAFTTVFADAKQHKKKPVPKPAPPVAAPVAIPSGMRLCDAPYPQPAWFLEVPKGFKIPEGYPHPAHYQLLSTIDSSFLHFLQGIPFEKSEPKKITLPVYLDQVVQCREMNIVRTMTLDSALQAEYPLLMSFKAFSGENALNAARIESDEKGARMRITWDKRVCFVRAIQYAQRTYYMCYTLDDPSLKKKTFE